MHLILAWKDLLVDYWKEEKEIGKFTTSTCDFLHTWIILSFYNEEERFDHLSFDSKH